MTHYGASQSNKSWPQEADKEERCKRCGVMKYMDDKVPAVCSTGEYSNDFSNPLSSTPQNKSQNDNNAARYDRLGLPIMGYDDPRLK